MKRHHSKRTTSPLSPLAIALLMALTACSGSSSHPPLSDGNITADADAHLVSDHSPSLEGSTRDTQGDAKKDATIPDDATALDAKHPNPDGKAPPADSAAPDIDPAIFCAELDDPHELIADRRFRRGFVALDQNTHKPVGPMPTGFCSEAPIWSVAQWDSLGDLSKSPRQTLANGSIRWSNIYGRVTVGLLSTSDADLAMGVWAYKEYGGQYHTPVPGRVWVHLLAEQRISPPGVSATRPGCPPISSLSSLNFKMGAKLLQDIPHKQAGYDPAKHAAQFLIYFTVQNLNTKSKGFGDYLWFGLMPYDDRHTLPGTYILEDLGGAMGTGRLIYNIGAKPFITVGMKAGAPEQMFIKDILPDIRLALLEAWKRGHLLDSKVLSDYRIGGMNIGWEVPGLNDVEMKVRDLSLRYETKKNVPLVFEFNKTGDREGWTAVNLTDTHGGPTQGSWILQVPGNDPYLLSPPLKLEAAAHKTLTLVVANDHNPPATSTLQVYWERFGEKGFLEAWSVSVPINSGGGWQTLKIDLSANPGWRGEISRIRIDPVQSGDGHAIGVDRIAL